MDEVTLCINPLERQKFAKPLVHIIDREADSIRHIWQWVAETPIRLTRDAKPSRNKPKKSAEPSIPVEARLIVSRVLADNGEILTEWLLMTNVVACY